MAEQRIVWLGETQIPPFGAPDGAWNKALFARHQEIESCDIAILFCTDVPTVDAVSELAFAVAKGRQAFYCPEMEFYEQSNVTSVLMRASTHYVRYLSRAQAAVVAGVLSQHACGKRVSLAFPEELLAIISKAESPIELRLGVHLAHSLELVCKVDPQVEIKFGDSRYRADFLISDKDIGLNLVVEADGHDFHERTKEQATRDKRRDREMLAAGFHVMRFTGTEVWKEPWRCADEVRNFVFGFQEK